MSLGTSELINIFGLLLDSALKGVLLVAAAAIAAYLLRSRFAAARHAAWTAAVIGHLALPAITLLAPAWRLPFLPAPPWLATEQTANSSPITVTTSEPSAPKSATITEPVSTPQPDRIATETGGGAATASAIHLPTGLSLLAALWVAGSVLVLLRLALGTMRVGKLARDGSRVIDGAWLSLAQRVAARLGISRPLTLLHGSRLGIPVTWGIVYPAVLLPPDAEEWPEERRRFVLVHEMAHIKRFDALTQLAAQLAVAIFWFDPLIWLAAHRMRVEREHACDDYVLRDGTKPSLYAGELLDMVRSLGTPEHERAAPAFAALAMARRSEFEGRMLAILDPKLDRHTLNRRSTLITAGAVALLVLPLAALRPFEQPGVKSLVKVPASTQGSSRVTSNATTTTNYTCDSADLGKSGSTSTHISLNEDREAGIRNLSYMVSAPGRCAEARMVGFARLSSDETRLVALPRDGMLRLREVLPGSDRSLVAVAGPNGEPSYVVRVGGRPVDFDADMKAWVSKLMPQVMREATIDVPQRVTRLRREGGVDGVLDDIARMTSTAAKTAHYKALLEDDRFTQSEIDRIARDAGRDLASSPTDLRSVLDLLIPQRVVRAAGSARRTAYPSAAAQASIDQSVQAAVRKAKSSGDKASILTQYAAGGDPEAVLMALRGAKELSSDGDKSTLLKTLAASALNGRNPALRRAFFDAFETLSSDGDKRSVLIAALPYGHANPAVTLDVIQGTRHISSDTDKAEVLIALTQQRLLASAAIRNAFLDAAKLISSSYDQRRVLQALTEQ
jgi:beta-lactamase regulating signal transducer with metallopeptidase domain